MLVTGALRGFVEIGERPWLDGVGFDLADAGEVVVEYGVERGGGFGRRRPFRLRLFRPPDGDEADEGKGSEDDEGQLPGVVEHVAEDDQELQNGGDGLIQPLDNNAVRGRDVAGDAGHDFPGGVFIKPRDGEALELVVELDADDVGELQLQVVVQVGAEGEKNLPGEDRTRTDQGGGNDEIRSVLADDHVDETHGDARQHQNERGAGDSQQQGEAAEKREA